MTFHGRNEFGNKRHESLRANLICSVQNGDKRLLNLSIIFDPGLTSLRQLLGTGCEYWSVSLSAFEDSLSLSSKTPLIIIKVV